MGMLLVSFGVMLLIVTAMAIGAIMGREPIKGSCGGVGAALGEKDYTCEICGGDPNKCEAEQESAGKQAKPDLFYEADKP